MSITVCVLLSSYNGEKYINEQIKSILSQENIFVKLLIRDDGSKDSTLDILKQFNQSRIEVLNAPNVGVTRSFFELIEKADDADYYAFADQDDVWDKDKLIIAIEKLHAYVDRPAIYSSNTRLVNNNLEFIKNEDSNPKTTLGSAFIKNYVTGCTTVFNRKLMNKLKLNTNVIVPYHDWWANLVALSLGGESIYDVSPHINYRQHDENLVGASDTLLKKWKSRLNKYLNKCYYRDQIASQLLQMFEQEVLEENVEILQKLMNYRKKKLSLIFDNRIKTGNFLDDFMFLVCVLTNKA
jgi:glycosyltransferase involved in cell wall biosynthesis